MCVARIFGVLLTLAGCEVVPEPTRPETGGQSGEDPVHHCGEAVAVIGPDEVVEGSEGGFTAGELRALAEGAFDAELTWEDGSTSDLAVTLVWDGEHRAYEPTLPGIYYPCTVRMELDGRYTFTTEDGALDETGDAVLSAAGLSLAAWGDRWDALRGTFTLPADATVDLRGFVDAAGVRGDLRLSGQTDGTSSSVATETCGAPPLATFGP